MAVQVEAEPTEKHPPVCPFGQIGCRRTHKAWLVDENDSDLRLLPSPKAEALALYALLGKNGDTVETICAVISVPPKIEAALRAYARKHAEEREGIERILRFRKRVAEEFWRLITEGNPDCSQTAIFRLNSLPGRNLK